MNTETKFTPGPWHRNIKPASKYPVVWAGRNTHVAALAVGARHSQTLSEAELEANIDLIAAAPELFEAVKNAAGLLDTPLARRRHSGDEFYDDVVASLRAALAKAVRS